MTSKSAFDILKRIRSNELLAALFLLCGHTYCYPSGAPNAACAGLQPIHGSTVAQTGESPFTFATTQSSIEQGGTISVNVSSRSSDTPFKGFLIVGVNREDDSVRLGSFADPGEDDLHQNGPCKDSEGEFASVTHINSSPKTSLNFNWTAPRDFIGTICFNGAAVKDFLEWWRIEGDCVDIVSTQEESGIPVHPETSTLSTPHTVIEMSNMGAKTDCHHTIILAVPLVLVLISHFFQLS